MKKIIKKVMQIIKSGFLQTFNYGGYEARSSYVLFSIFQVSWFCLYLKIVAYQDLQIGFIPLLLLLMPMLASASRRINDAGYSRGVFILLIVAPYLLFPFLAFPASVKKE